MQKDLLPVLEALVKDFIIFYHLVGFIDSAHMDVIIANSLRSGNGYLVVPLILCAIFGKSVAGSIEVSRMKGAHYRHHAPVHPLNDQQFVVTVIAE